MTQQIDTNLNRVQLQGILKWFTDSEAPRANFIVDSDIAPLPKEFMETADQYGHVILNFSWQSTRNFQYFDTGVEFNCRRMGVEFTLFVPYKAIIGYQTDKGVMLYNYFPTPEDEAAEEPEYFLEGNAWIKNPEYRQQFQQLILPEVKKEIQEQTTRHLRLVHGARTKKDLNREPVDPKLRSYPFPEDRFAEYNARQDLTRQENPVEDIRIVAEVCGHIFVARPKPKRVRPTWLVVIEGGKQ